MPSYSFRCSAGCRFDARFAMSEVPAETVCRVCGAEARRTITAPHLSRAGTAAFGLLDRSARSAHEPEVVDRLPARAPGRAQRTTTNPLHAKLPRP
ncbi:zinc ribbon domain-containing protein [Leucobacter allii]|uniref:Zinc ribbon domain-containing protein n=1 Tax=Leucobacter allii TaxID=2932247 RepID=A0ABY4FPE8_9MICO|nr:zinc ribbon domain-containing protein [Leucobacter allii]UOQ58157.1 zinc ribbon domain-containing protein [Leucobacter allii]UOR02739.1 zinc ribbon domain-containing protein [Leucobacter allii]